MLTLALLLYNCLFPLAFLVALPRFLRKQRKRGGGWDGFGERFGWFAAAKRARLRALTQPVWIHACSVGEVQAALLLLEAWRREAPEQPFVVSTTTTTGQRIARERVPDDVVVIYFPLDFWWCVRCALAAVRPAMLVVLEVEIWPTVLTMAKGRGVRTALVNGRLSDRSYRGYRRHRWLFGPLLRSFDVICMQSDEDGRRMRELAGDGGRVRVCSTMKFDLAPSGDAADLTGLMDAVFGRRAAVLVAASTHAGEEEAVGRVVKRLAAGFPGLRTVVVPRHAERAAEVEQALEAAGVRVRRLTAAREAMAAARALEPVDVLIGDTTGELMALMATADVVFMGKSLGDCHGGHNIIEPAVLGKAIVHGPNMENFRLVSGRFAADGAALAVADEDALAAAVRRLLEEPETRVRMGAAAKQTVERNRGAVGRTLRVLRDLEAAG